MRPISLLSFLALAVACWGNGLLSAAELKLGSLPVNRILVLGNSITFHPTALDWEGGWGMAASTQDKDFAHLLAARIGNAAGGKPQLVAMNIADFERQHATWDFQTPLKDTTNAELLPDAYQPDLVVLAIGENVPALETPEAQAAYEKAFTRLIEQIKQRNPSGPPTIIVRSCFWKNPAKDDIMRRVCAETGGYFVSLEGLDQDEKNFARSERSFEHPGVGGHPGDKGMAAIADALWKAIEKIPAVKAE